MSTLTPATAFTELLLEVFQLNGRLLAAGDRLSAPLGLSSARWQVMGALASGPAPVAQIARTMGLTRQSVQRTVDVLAAEDVVAFATNPHHKRAKLVMLTGTGVSLLDRVSVLQRAWACQTAEGLTTDSLVSATVVLRTLRHRLDQAAGDDDTADTEA